MALDAEASLLKPSPLIATSFLFGVLKRKFPRSPFRNLTSFRPNNREGALLASGDEPIAPGRGLKLVGMKAAAGCDPNPAMQITAKPVTNPRALLHLPIGCLWLRELSLCTIPSTCMAR
eukprot:2660548-Rhodomonas_salina.1